MIATSLLQMKKVNEVFRIHSPKMSHSPIFIYTLNVFVPILVLTWQVSYVGMLTDVGF